MTFPNPSGKVQDDSTKPTAKPQGWCFPINLPRSKRANLGENCWGLRGPPSIFFDATISWKLWSMNNGHWFLIDLSWMFVEIRYIHQVCSFQNIGHWELLWQWSHPANRLNNDSCGPAATRTWVRHTKLPVLKSSIKLVWKNRSIWASTSSTCLFSTQLFLDQGMTWRFQGLKVGLCFHDSMFFTFFFKGWNQRQWAECAQRQQSVYGAGETATTQLWSESWVFIAWNPWPIDSFCTKFTLPPGVLFGVKLTIFFKLIDQ